MDINGTSIIECRHLGLESKQNRVNAKSSTPFIVSATQILHFLIVFAVETDLLFSFSALVVIDFHILAAILYNEAAILNIL